MPAPADETLYNKVKNEIYTKYPNHSAYRSGLLVKKYKEEFLKKHPNKQPYKEPKPTNQQGLKRWFGENWTNQRGEVGYKYKSDVYRPNVRVNRDTPTTFNELTKKELSKAIKEKASLGRVRKFKEIK